MNERSDISVVLGVERFALLARYAVLLAIILVARSRLVVPEVWLVLIIIIAHQVFSHWVFLKKRGDVFTQTLNFIVYFAEATLIILIAGSSKHEAYPLFIILLIGMSVYDVSPQTLIASTVLCVATFILVIWVKMHFVVGTGLTRSLIFTPVISMLICGWLLSRWGRLLRETRAERDEHAFALASSETKMRLIFDSAANPIIVFDDNLFITEANSTACEAIGVSREQLIGRRIQSFLFDDGTLSNRIADLRARGEYSGEQILINSEGEEENVDITACTYVLDGKRYFACVFQDISERKDLQKAKRLATENLEDLSRKLRQVSELRTGFLSTISQKIRSSLSIMLGPLEMLLDEKLGDTTPDQRQALQLCRRGAQRIMRVVEDSLEIDKTDSKDNE